MGLMKKIDFVYQNFDVDCFVTKIDKWKFDHNLNFAQMLIDCVVDVKSIRKELIYFKFFKGKNIPKVYKKFLTKHKNNFSDGEIKDYFVNKLNIRNVWEKENVSHLSHYMSSGEDYNFLSLIGSYAESGEFFRKLHHLFDITLYAAISAKPNSNWMQAYCLHSFKDKKRRIIIFEFDRRTPANDRVGVVSEHRNNAESTHQIIKNLNTLDQSYMDSKEGFVKLTKDKFIENLKKQFKKRGFEFSSRNKRDQKNALKILYKGDERLPFNLNNENNENFETFFDAFKNDEVIIKNYINEDPKKYFPKIDKNLQKSMNFIVNTLKEYWRENPLNKIKDCKFYQFIMKPEFRWCNNKNFINEILYSCNDIYGLLQYIPIKIQQSKKFAEEIRILKMFRTDNKKYLIKIFNTNKDKLDALTENYMPTTILNDPYLMMKLIKIDTGLMTHIGDALKKNKSFMKKVMKFINK